MKTKLNREQIYAMYFVLTEEMVKKADQLKFNDIGAQKWFSMAVNRNVELLEPEVRNIMIARQTSVKEYTEYIQKREETLKKDSKKDDKGNPIIENNQYTYENDEIKNNVSIELAKLIEQYKGAIEARNREVQAYNEIIEEQIEVEVCKCSYKYFPDNITPSHFEVLKPMIKETVEELEQML